MNYRTSIGLRVKDGIVLAVEKLVHSKLLVPESNRRIQTIDRHIGLVRALALFGSKLRSHELTRCVAQATSGLPADARHLAGRARDEATDYRNTYHAPAPLKARPNPLLFNSLNSHRV